MKHLDLFSGIGGFALAASWVWKEQYDNVGFVEIDEYCQKLLAQNFKGAKIHGDIRTFKPTGRVDLLTGGFPCQPFSQAGKRKGKDDNRFLWPEMLRVIKECSPRWVVGENVGGIFTIDGGLVFEQIHVDLGNAGYEVQAYRIPAVAVGAPHRRDRWWFVAKNTIEYRTHRAEVKDGKRIVGDAGARDGERIYHAPHTGREHGAGQQDQREFERTAGQRDAVELERPASGDKLRTVADTAGIGRGERKQKNNRSGENGTTDRFSETITDAADTKSERGRRFSGEERGIHGRVVVQDESERSEVWCEGQRRSGQRNGAGNDWGRPWIEVATEFCRVDDGVSHRVDRLKGLGNAIVPQVAEVIFKAIKEQDEKQ